MGRVVVVVARVVVVVAERMEVVVAGRAVVVVGRDVVVVTVRVVVVVAGAAVVAGTSDVVSAGDVPEAEVVVSPELVVPSSGAEESESSASEATVLMGGSSGGEGCRDEQAVSIKASNAANSKDKFLFKIFSSPELFKCRLIRRPAEKDPCFALLIIARSLSGQHLQTPGRKR
ncbi:MAG: hypothetical protein HFJ80_08330 [Clostridiales bacterium]|nr:hypothetical protein [Clostridiales bacterium]